MAIIEEILLLFDASHPCWSEKTLMLEGIDPSGLEFLEKDGLLGKRGNLFFLTNRGRERYEKTAKTYCVTLPPGISKDAPREHKRTLLELLLNRSFQGRWGIKEFRPGEPLEYLPDLRNEALWEESKEGFRWLYSKNPHIRSLEETWPLPRKMPEEFSHNRSAWESWIRERGLFRNALELDLLFLHHYDSEHFQHLSPPPEDRQKLFHTDRFYFQFLPSPEEIPRKLWNELGQFQLWMMLQRRIFLPWYFDRDTTGYDSVNWWFWVTEREEELKILFRHVRPRGEALVEPALPLQLFGISLETLEESKEKHEYHWDLFEKIASPLSPAL